MTRMLIASAAIAALVTSPALAQNFTFDRSPAWTAYDVGAYLARGSVAAGHLDPTNRVFQGLTPSVVHFDRVVAERADTNRIAGLNKDGDPNAKARPSARSDAAQNPGQPKARLDC